MAKVISLQGKARGKIGGIVYRVEAGIGMIASEYNPSPHNPRTIAQTNQRSKMNLAGQISKITPYAAIAGMGVNRREARSRFVSMLLKNINHQSATNESSINFEGIELSKGLPVVFAATKTSGSDEGRLSYTISVEQSPMPLLGYIAVVYYKDVLGNEYCNAEKLDATATSFTFNYNSELFESEHYAFYLVPIIDTGEAARVAYGQLNMGMDNFKTEVVRSLVSAGAYGKSMFIETGTLY